MTAVVRIGVDLGGTKIEAIALNTAGVEIFRRRVSTPKGDYDATVDAVRRLVDAADAAAGVKGRVGVGMPGAISPATGLVKNANSTWLIGRTLKEDLERAIDRPVRLENDANCFALSEATDGAGAGHGIVFGVILGTGTGGGVVVHGRSLVGANAIAGEWGHNPLPWPAADERPGPPCYCGQHGCIETYLSGAGLERAYRECGGAAGHPERIAASAGQGEPQAAAALDLYAHRLARALASVINVLDPDVIVLGGGLSNIETLYARVPALWSRWVFSDRVDTILARARHGDSSGVRGAAWLAS
jgi:predicted NBD/HSP70 family sugar kinase